MISFLSRTPLQDTSNYGKLILKKNVNEIVKATIKYS